MSCETVLWLLDVTPLFQLRSPTCVIRGVLVPANPCMQRLTRKYAPLCRIASAEEWLPLGCPLPSAEVTDPAAITRCVHLQP